MIRSDHFDSFGHAKATRMSELSLQILEGIEDKEGITPAAATTTTTTTTAATSSTTTITTVVATTIADYVSCNAGHCLKIIDFSGDDYGDGWVCDVCEDATFGSRFSCRSCSYDCCVECYLKAKTASSWSLSPSYAYSYTDFNFLASKGNANVKKILDYLDVVQCDQYKQAFLETCLDEIVLQELCTTDNNSDMNYSEKNHTYLTDVIGVHDGSHRELLSTMLHNLHKKACMHLCAEKWDGQYVCIQCFRYFNCDMHPNNLRDSAREVREREIECTVTNRILDPIPPSLSFEQQKDHIGKLSQGRGIPIGWLVDFTNEHDCWDMSTQNVCLNYVFPATAARRCRYVELDHMAGITGPASTFISHCRGGKWGDLVAAVCDGGADRNRRVWVDIFACRQWPCSSPDLHFDDTIRNCSSFLVVCSSLKDVEDLDWDKVYSHQSNLLPRHVKSQIAFIRVWCLVEIYTASQCKDLPIVMKGGSYMKKATDRNLFKFSHNWRMLNKMSDLIDINNAEATIPQDKEMILAMIRGKEGDEDGVEKLNTKVRSTIKSIRNAAIDKNSAMLQNAACGDCSHLELVNAYPMYYLECICTGGHLTLLKDCIFRSHKDQLSESPDKLVEAMTKASSGGHTDIVRLFIENKADVDTKSKKSGWTPLMCACNHGFFDTVKLLIDNEADVNIKDGDNGWTALMLASKGGHVEIVQLLAAECGADVNAKNKYGSSPLMKACEKGHIKVVRILLDNRADITTKNEFGESLLMEACRTGRIDLVKLFIVRGADMLELDLDGKSALDHAREEGGEVCVRYLEAIIAAK